MVTLVSVAVTTVAGVVPTVTAVVAAGPNPRMGTGGLGETTGEEALRRVGVGQGRNDAPSSVWRGYCQLWLISSSPPPAVSVARVWPPPLAVTANSMVGMERPVAVDWASNPTYTVAD